MKKPIYKNWWFWVIIVVAVIIIFSSAGNSGDSNDGSGAGGNNPGANTSNTYGVGDTLTTDEFKITLTKAEVWTGYNQYLPPKDGYKIVRVYFVIENITSSDKGTGSWDFDCYADGLAMSEYYTGEDTLSGFDSISS